MNSKQLRQTAGPLTERELMDRQQVVASGLFDADDALRLVLYRRAVRDEFYTDKIDGVGISNWAVDFKWFEQTPAAPEPLQMATGKHFHPWGPGEAQQACYAVHPVYPGYNG